VGMANHDETMPSVLDNKDAIIVEEALADELQGDDAIRHYKKGMWTVSELLVLQAVRREDFERQAKGGSREKHRYAVSWTLLQSPLSTVSDMLVFFPFPFCCILI
jgi:hypothetical protein